MKMSSVTTGGLFQNTRQESKIILKAEHSFGNFTSNINSSDKIWFKGKLKTSMASSSKTGELFSSCKNNENRGKYSYVYLNSIGCLHCADKNLLPVGITSKFNLDNNLKHLSRGLKYMLNILFNPLITFK